MTDYTLPGTLPGTLSLPTVKTLQGSAFELLERMLPKVMIDLPAPVVERVREVCGDIA